MARRSVGDPGRLFVKLPDSKGDRLLVTRDVVEGDRLVLGTDSVSRTLGRGHKPDKDGIIRVPIQSAREIE